MPDDVTGLPTHRDFPLGLSDQSPCAVLVDVDSLIWLNDQLGLAAGDAALSLLARTLVREVEDFPGSAVFRVGGDEFLVVLPGLAPDSVERSAHAIVAAVHALKIPYRRTDQPARCTLEVNAVVFRLGSRFMHESFGQFGLKDPGRDWIEDNIHREKKRSQAVGVVVNLARGGEAA